MTMYFFHFYGMPLEFLRIRQSMAAVNPTDNQLNENNKLDYIDPFQAVEATDDTFWDQFWSESAANISDVFTLIPASEIRSLRDENPSNLATLCYKVSSIFDYVLPC